jgi:SAM-dependent methyltransferase
VAFTAHNIRLDDGTRTLPEGFPMEQHPRFLAAERCLRLVFPQGFNNLSIADLGCLEGGYAVEFARLGFRRVIGIEIRPSNFTNCLAVKNGVALPNLVFVNDDVWNIKRYGPFDAIFCCGLFYHLDRPKAFLDLLARMTRTVLVIHTHFATVMPIAEFNLSELTHHEGLLGRWYEEGEARDQDKWASWSNPRSFWIERRHLLEAIGNAGFPLVFEQFDLAKPLPTDANRGMFVGVKSGEPVGARPGVVAWMRRTGERVMAGLSKSRRTAGSRAR